MFAWRRRMSSTNDVLARLQDGRVGREQFQLEACLVLEHASDFLGRVDRRVVQEEADEHVALELRQRLVTRGSA